MFEVRHNRAMALSTAKDRFATQWETQEYDLNALLDRLSRSVAGAETHAEFMALSKDEQTERKDVGGFCGGEIVGNGQRTRANIAGRELLTLDFDDLPADNGKVILANLRALNCFFIVHSTRKHSLQTPRLRILLPLSRLASVDEYGALSRKVAEILDIEACDPASFRENQLMFWPSHCADVDPIFQYEDKPLLDVDSVLRMYGDWRDASKWPQAKKAQKAMRRAVQTKATQQDPTKKDGIVGEFCRCFNVLEAIVEFIPDAYEPFRNSADRLTFKGGSTTGGAVLYENDRFLYSFHATDPAGGRLCNAFDLVRLHRFGHLDGAAAPETPINRLPSYAAMRKFAQALPAIQALHVEEQGNAVLSQTNDLPDGASDTEKQSYKEFFGQLEGYTLTTKVVRDTLNFLGIDLRTNEITGDIELSGYPKRWSRESALENLPTFLLDRFLLSEIKHSSKDRVVSCLGTIADEQRYNPVLEMFKSRPWDGQDRLSVVYSILYVTDALDKILIHKWLIQSAGLPANDPANPFGADGVLALQGEQGIGKTSFFREIVPSPLRHLFKEGAEIDTRNKDSVMQITASWICELGELERTTKKDEASLRPFITAAQDQFRAPYARSATKRARRTSFCATVNPEKFLTDEEGNRRFWTIPIKSIDLGKLRSLDDEFKQQLWAQIYAEFCADRCFSFRLSKGERSALNDRNVEYTKAIDYELEVLDLCDFHVPVEDWRWMRCGDIGKEIERRTNRFPPLNRLGRALTKIANDNPRVETKVRNKRMMYKLPMRAFDPFQDLRDKAMRATTDPENLN